jgi:hypothetical protein
MQGWLVGLVVSYVRAARLVALATPLFLSACGDEHVIQWREEVVDAAGERMRGGSCAELGAGDEVGSGSGVAPIEGETPTTPSYQLKWVGLADGVQLSVFDVYGELVEERDFDQAFLDSGERIEIMPPLEGGSLRLTVWGGDRCDSIDASEFE